MNKILFIIGFCLFLAQLTPAQTSPKQKLAGTWVTSKNVNSAVSVNRTLTFNLSGKGLRKLEFYDENGKRFSIVSMPFSYSVRKVSEDECHITYEYGKVTDITNGKETVDVERSYATTSNTYFFEGKNILIEYGGETGNDKYVRDQ